MTIADAILATGLVLLAALSFTAGLILDTVTRGRREARLLHCVSMPGPLSDACTEICP